MIGIGSKGQYYSRLVIVLLHVYAAISEIPCLDLCQTILLHMMDESSMDECSSAETSLLNQLESSSIDEVPVDVIRRLKGIFVFIVSLFATICSNLLNCFTHSRSSHAAVHCRRY